MEGASTSGEPPRTHRSPLKRLSLSPPVWKDQLRRRCFQRLKQDRTQLLAKLRCSDGRTSVTEEMQQLVAHVSSCASSAASVDDLLLLGKLTESDYFEIVHALEDALRQDEEEEELLHMADLEDAELEAMLAGLDLDDVPQEQELKVVAGDQELVKSTTALEISVLCPQCKTGYLREERLDGRAVPFLSCSCGFTFIVQSEHHSVLEEFQDKILNAFLTHRDSCSADPTFDKMTKLFQDHGPDVLRIKCTTCKCDYALP
uniref:RPA-interacting protein C-terminal domain-containing protein n=1 Tax=Peronospora matthiolae TaxID=2874970 RepID=A0AAV1VNB4_9STRA